MTQSGPLLVLRADAGGLTGSGHVMRLLALGEAWTGAGGHCLLVSAALPEGLRARVVEGAGFGLHMTTEPAWSRAEAAVLAGLCAARGARAVAVDSYSASVAYIAALSDAGLVVAVIDDMGALPDYPCAVLVNQNLHAEEALYAGKAARPLALLGPRFALLRQEFAHARAAQRVIRPRARNVLMTFGGVDPTGASLLAVEAARLLPEDFKLTLVIGAANVRAEEIAARAAGAPCLALAYNPPMAALMQEADMALSAGGTTVWEACALGLPMLLVAVNAEEAVSAERLARAGACLYAGPRQTLDPERLAAAIAGFADDLASRLKSNTLGRMLVDAHGAGRVTRAIAEAAGLAVAANE